MERLRHTAQDLQSALGRIYRQLDRDRKVEFMIDAHRGDLAERLSEVVARRRVAGPRERVRLHRVIEAIRAGLESDAARLQLLGAHDAELVAKARSLQDRLDRILRDIRAMRPGAPSAGPT